MNDIIQSELQTDQVSKSSHMTHTYHLLTLDDVAEELENSVIQIMQKLKKDASLRCDVTTFSDADADYEVAMLSVGENVIIYSEQEAIKKMQKGGAVIYHLQLWSNVGREYRHMAKTSDLNKIIEAGLHLTSS